MKPIGWGNVPSRRRRPEQRHGVEPQDRDWRMFSRPTGLEWGGVILEIRLSHGSNQLTWSSTTGIAAHVDPGGRGSAPGDTQPSLGSPPSQCPGSSIWAIERKTQGVQAMERLAHLLRKVLRNR